MSNIYSYHARFHESIPSYYIDKYSNKYDTILDPFCGSGTTLQESLKLGRNSIGIDISPIAYLTSKVNTFSYQNEELVKIFKWIQESFNESIIFKKIDFPNSDKWYTVNNYNQLCKLYFIISIIEKEEYKDFFLLCFLSTANKVINKRDIWNIGYIADNVLPNRQSKFNAYDSFLSKVEKEIKEITNNEFIKGTNVQIYKQDINNINLNEPVDMVMTSPPYPFAVDFIRYHRISMYWLQEDIEELTQMEIGARNKRNRKNNLEKFFYEIEMSFCNIMKMVKSDGYWVMTIADTTRNKEKIPFVDWTINLFIENGWILLEDRIRKLQKQTMAQKRIPSEHILVFKKI